MATDLEATTGKPFRHSPIDLKCYVNIEPPRCVWHTTDLKIFEHFPLTKENSMQRNSRSDRKLTNDDIEMILHILIFLGPFPMFHYTGLNKTT